MPPTQYAYLGRKKPSFERYVDDSSERYDDDEPKELESFGVDPDISVHRLETKSKVAIPPKTDWAANPPPSLKALAINKAADSVPQKPMRDPFIDQSKAPGYARIKSIHVDTKKFGFEKAKPLKPRVLESFADRPRIPVRIQSQVHALGKHREAFQSGLPPALRKWAVSKTLRPALKPMRSPFSDRRAVHAITREREVLQIEMPPSLRGLAVDKAAYRAKKPMRDPFTARSQVQALGKNREVFQALLDGEWVLCDDIGFFPRRLREWLSHCRVRLLRWEGGISIQAPTGTPLNAYVTEDGTVFYVAEDSTTFYVQES